MKQLTRAILIYKVALLIGVLFAMNAAAIACVAAFTGIDWSQLTRTQHFVIICAVAANFSNTMLAFLNKTLSRIEAGKSLIETGDTDPPFKPKET